LLGWFGFGEGWHNNHHAFPNSARFGHRGFQFDPGWWVLQLGEKLGVISELNHPTPEQMRRKRQELK
jgi:stearoyl-CoA desaturase (delta-9 desaturase)